MQEDYYGARTSARMDLLVCLRYGLLPRTSGSPRRDLGRARTIYPTRLLKLISQRWAGSSALGLAQRIASANQRR